MSDDNMTRAEVAKALGLSKPQVRKIEEKALRKLRRHPVLRQWFGLPNVR